MEAWILTLVTFSPLVGVVVLLFLRKEKESTIRWTALIAAIVTFVLSLVMLAGFDPSDLDLQMVVRVPWFSIGDLHIEYFLGVDGLSILLVLLTTFLTVLAIISTWNAIQDRVREFMIFFLLLEIGMVGVFLGMDLFLFYIFWEFTLVPMYFLIGVWGGENRMYAAVKFFLYTMAGSIFMLLAIIWLGLGAGTFAVTDLIEAQAIPATVQVWLFPAFAAAFGIKVSMLPRHDGVPAAHVVQPYEGSGNIADRRLTMVPCGVVP